MAKYRVTARNMSAFYDLGEFEANDEFDARQQAIARNRGTLVGLHVSASVVR